MFPVVGKVEVLAMMAGVVERHRRELGTPPAGILDVVCADGLCRICCDWVKHCSCNSSDTHQSHPFDGIQHAATPQAYKVA
jgi:hypothetical protein